MTTVTEIKTPFGHSLPPQGPHTVTLHAPGWENAMKFRDGDRGMIMQLKSIYPRFFPFGPCAMLMRSMAAKLELVEGQGVVAFLGPEVWHENRDHAVSKFRAEHALKEDDMKYHVVDIDGVRLYLVAFPAQKMMGAIFMWQHAGRGFSSRLAEHLLTKMDTLKYAGEFADGANPPAPTYLPEVESHELLRKRIADLMMRATVQEYEKPVQPGDVYLCQSGMAGIIRFHDVAVKLRPYPVAVFGAVFHSTWHLFEESPQGLKHYGKSNEDDLNEFEQYLEQGGQCSYVFTEFPSNPILVSVDLLRLRKLADKYGFWIVADDTVSSFCNIDLLSVFDALASSLTKTFSGYADVLAGSLTLNPNRASYQAVKPLLDESFHNEFYSGDAVQLLENSNDYLARSQILNRNAEAMTAYFHSLAQDPKTPVKKVLYPPHSDGSQYLSPFIRKPTPEFPKPGYGCLFSVELETLEDTIVFYDNLAFHQGPHLGAHLTLAMPYNATIYGREHVEYHQSYGLSHNQIRISVGLEDAEYLVEVCRKAVAAMVASEVSKESLESKMEPEVE